MAQVRALTKLLHNSIIREAGEVFDMADDMVAKLTGDVSEGMELVTKKTTAAYAKAQAEAQAALQATANALRSAYNDLKSQLDADPSRGDLVQRVLDAEAAAVDAEKAANANATGLV